MSSWISYHLYPLDVPEVFLQRAVRPFLAQHIWPEKGARAFFVRYADEKGEHIRLRLRGEDDWLKEKVIPALTAWMDGRGEMVEKAYLPETERYGGTTLMPWAEEYFHISTRVCLDLCAKEKHSYGDALYELIRMHLITAYNAGLNTEKTAWYFRHLCTQWLELYFKPADGSALTEDDRNAIKNQFSIAFKQQSQSLNVGMRMLWDQLEKDQLEKKEPEWLRLHRGSQLIFPEFGDQLEKVLPSFLHLNANRIGIHNQDEVYVAYILGEFRG